MYTKPLLVLLLVIQCAFLVFTLVSASEANGHLHGAIANLRNASQSNIARLDQNEARETRSTLERLANNQKFNTTITLLVSFLSTVLMLIVIMPWFMRTSRTAQRERPCVEF
jgi:hypothetical protein